MVYLMWLAAAPVVLFFGPLGNILLGWVRKETMLYTVLLMNLSNYLYFVAKNPTYLVPAVIAALAMTAIFIGSFYLKRIKNH
jgi:hypothetical protein